MSRLRTGFEGRVTVAVVLCLAVGVHGANAQQSVFTPKDSAWMVRVPAGKFVYGVAPQQRDSLIRSLGTPLLQLFQDEFRRQIKELPSYLIDRCEVTNAQYARFVRATGHRAPRYWKSRILSYPAQPVVGVGWDDARAYARWAGKRLPTEEEWEKAARGADGRFWPWGNRPGGERYNGKSQGRFAPAAVGSFPAGASPYGVQDMAGNVYEMTTGRWGDGPAMRGGSYLNSGPYTVTTFRWAAEDTVNGAPWLGFRCVKDGP